VNDGQAGMYRQQRAWAGRVGVLMADNTQDSRRGWRLFACRECGRVYWAATRDRLSPSNDVCRCGGCVLPLDSEPDELLEVDAFGNLVGIVPDRILRHGDGNE